MVWASEGDDSISLSCDTFIGLHRSKYIKRDIYLCILFLHRHFIFWYYFSILFFIHFPPASMFLNKVVIMVFINTCFWIFFHQKLLKKTFSHWYIVFISTTSDSYPKFTGYIEPSHILNQSHVKCLRNFQFSPTIDYAATGNFPIQLLVNLQTTLYVVKHFLFLSFFFCGEGVLCGLQDLSSPTRDWTHILAVKAWSPNHWISREFPC